MQEKNFNINSLRGASTCWVGWAFRKRAARVAATGLVAVLGLFSISYGQKNDKTVTDVQNAKIVRTLQTGQSSQLTGVLTDPNGAVVAGAVVRLLFNDSWNEQTTNIDGIFRFERVAVGSYDLSIKSHGFADYQLKNFLINDNEKVELNVELRIAVPVCPVDLNYEFPNIITVDPKSSTIQNTLILRKISPIPHN